MRKQRRVGNAAGKRDHVRLVKQLQQFADFRRLHPLRPGGEKRRPVEAVGCRYAAGGRRILLHLRGHAFLPASVATFGRTQYGVVAIQVDTGSFGPVGPVCAQQTCVSGDQEARLITNLILCQQY